MSMGFGHRRRGSSTNYRHDDDGSPRATFRHLLPFLMEHKRVLSVVIALSMAGALTTLAQPLVVSQVITVVEAAEPLRTRFPRLRGLLSWLRWQTFLPIG